MTIAQHIAKLRMRLVVYGDDQIFTDEGLYYLLNDARNVILSRRLRDHLHVSDFSYNAFCVNLERTTFHDCDCLPNSDCLVLKSVQELPEPISNRYGMAMMVLTPKGKRLSYINISQLGDLKHTRHKKNVPLWSILDRKLIIFNNLNYKTLIINSIVSDVSELVNFESCDNENNNTCFNPEQDEYPVDSDLIEDMYRIVIDSLKPALSVTQSNDHPKP